MPVLITCPHCPQRMTIPDNLVGKQVQCPGCKKVIMAKAPQPAAAVAAGGTAAPRPAPSTPAPSAPPSSAARTPPSGTTSTLGAAAATPAVGTKNICPACKAPLLEGAIACMDCGFLIAGDIGAVAEGPPNLCTNEACGVANPPGERTCQRCGNPLPTPPGTGIQNRYKLDRLLAMAGFAAVHLAPDNTNGNRPTAMQD